MTWLLAAYLFVSSALAANITFASEKECGGLGIYGSRLVDDIPCYDISSYEAAYSVVLADLSNQIVTIYSDDACNTQLARATGDTCLDFGGNRANSFKIVSTNSTVDDAAVSTSGTTDLVPYGVKLSDYKGLSQTSPYDIDLKFNIGYVSTALIYTGTTLTIGAAIAGCYITVGNPLAITICVATGVGTLATYAGKYLAHTHHKKTHGTYFFGNRKITSRAMIDASNYDYLSSIHNDELSFQVGWMEKDMGYGIQRSPIYRVNTTEDLGHFHFTAFYDENTGLMEHLMEFAHEPVHVALSKRASYQSYDSVTKPGYGLAYQFCPFSTSSSSPSWGQSQSSVYSRVQDQDQCLYSSSSYQKTTAFLMDFHNNNGNIIGSINAAPYKSGSSPNYQGLTQCTKQVASTNEDCIIN
ncbi:hypothetical protein PRZ48_002277 [Zasmidium cellare]|uniref:Uncharacterized protein n=1 Tax=Zasmidium cellare TaxID=395010 RepID=A0ABR0F6G9_ZASCE|nr:hypothetical protein PRZ48_002277 [Zasmidium cellare]